MPAHRVDFDDTYVLNHCSRHLARKTGAPTEAWRFPIVDSYGEPGLTAQECAGWNSVTFVLSEHHLGAGAGTVELLGTFAPLYERLPLRRVLFGGEPTPYHAVAVRVGRGEAHLYRFIVDGRMLLDPVNPQRTLRPDDRTEWSRFFTMAASQPLVLERWEYVLLDRLCDHILPFRSKLAENFLDRHYNFLSEAQRNELFRHAYRFDQSIGVVNFIDKLLAREEQHRLIDYRLCLGQMDRVLRERYPPLEPEQMPRDIFLQLYTQMANNHVTGWDYQKYREPAFFLEILRRHAFTGAFSHPKYGGNAVGAAWAYLGERYLDAAGQTQFDWRQAVEKPLGTNEEYRG